MGLCFSGPANYDLAGSGEGRRFIPSSQPLEMKPANTMPTGFTYDHLKISAVQQIV